MINIIQLLLQNEKFEVLKDGDRIILSRSNLCGYPEVYIEIEKIHDKFAVSEVHRDTKQIRIETEEENEANIYAVILYKRLYDEIIDKVRARSIRRYLDAGEEKKALDCIAGDFDDALFSIDSEDKQKISLIHSSGGIDVKFGGEYLAENATLSRGYVVLYNYCEKLRYISSFYDEMCQQSDYTINRESTIKMYILGK